MDSGFIISLLLYTLLSIVAIVAVALLTTLFVSRWNERERKRKKSQFYEARSEITIDQDQFQNIHYGQPSGWSKKKLSGSGVRNKKNNPDDKSSKTDKNRK